MTSVTDQFNIGLCQYGMTDIQNFDMFLERLSSQFEKVQGADLIVLPELVVNDYTGSVESPVEKTIIEKEEHKKYHDFLCTHANDNKAVVVGGSYNINIKGQVFNRCPIALPENDVVCYDKRCPTPKERELGKSMGRSSPPTITYNGVDMSVGVCYDVEFPSYINKITSSGVDILIVPSWTTDNAGFQRVRRCAMARAIENNCYVVQVCLVDIRQDNKLSATGQSGVYAPCDNISGPHGTRLKLPRNEHAVATYGANINKLRYSETNGKTVPNRDARENFQFE